MNSVSSLAGDNDAQLSGVRLALLEGINGDKYLLGYNDLMDFKNGCEEMLGFIDPVTIATVATVAVNIFGSLFAPERYQDAYNVWNAAAQALPSLQDYPAQDMWVYRALIAVLGVDYMNPPYGANVCTSSGRCGNRAEWSKIQQDVQAKAQQVAPFFYWLRSTEGTSKQPAGYPAGWDMEGNIQCI